MFIPETAQSSLALCCSSQSIISFEGGSRQGQTISRKSKIYPRTPAQPQIDSLVLHFLPTLQDSGDEDMHRQDTYPDLFY